MNIFLAEFICPYLTFNDFNNCHFDFLGVALLLFCTEKYGTEIIAPNNNTVYDEYVVDGTVQVSFFLFFTSYCQARF